jgi:hypothetical protein
LYALSWDGPYGQGGVAIPQGKGTKSANPQFHVKTTYDQLS